MALIEDQAKTIAIDAIRSIEVTPTTQGTLVLSVEDPASVAIVELIDADILALYELLEDWVVEHIKKTE